MTEQDLKDIHRVDGGRLMGTCIDCGGPKSAISPGSQRCSACATKRSSDLNKASSIRSRNSAKARSIVLAQHLRFDDRARPYMVCHCCGVRFDPGRTRWRADHIRRHAEGGEETVENLLPIRESCDRAKAAKDTTEVAKGKRWKAKHFGTRSPRKPMPGSRASGWRKRMDGRVERR